MAVPVAAVGPVVGAAVGVGPAVGAAVASGTDRRYNKTTDCTRQYTSSDFRILDMHSFHHLLFR